MCFIPDHAQGIERYYLKPNIRDPLSALYRFLLEKGFRRDEYQIIDVDTFFIPVWRAQGQVTGWIAGLSPFKTYEYTEVVRTPTGSQVAMKRKRQEGGVPLKKLIRLQKEMLFPAVKRKDIRFRVEEVMKEEHAPFLRIYDQKEMEKWGHAFTPDTPPHIKRKEIRQRFIASVRSLYLGYDPLHDRLKVIGERLFLYYFPLALVKATIDNKLVFLSVNAISGRVASGAPIEKRKEVRKLPQPLTDTAMVFFSSVFASLLFNLESAVAQQVAIGLIIIVMIILWTKK